MIYAKISHELILQKKFTESIIILYSVLPMSYNVGNEMNPKISTWSPVAMKQML